MYHHVLYTHPSVWTPVERYPVSKIKLKGKNDVNLGILFLLAVYTVSEPICLIVYIYHALCLCWNSYPNTLVKSVRDVGMITF